MPDQPSPTPAAKLRPYLPPLLYLLGGGALSAGGLSVTYDRTAAEAAECEPCPECAACADCVTVSEDLEECEAASAALVGQLAQLSTDLAVCKGWE